MSHRHVKVTWSWLIAINSTSTSTSQTIDDSCICGTYYVITPTPTLLLFIVHICTSRFVNKWFIAFYSNVLPKLQRSRSLSPDSVAKWCQTPKVILSRKRPLLYYLYCIILQILFKNFNFLCKFSLNLV